MKIFFFSIREFEKPLLNIANKGLHEMLFSTESLNAETANLAAGCNAIAIFTNDDACAAVIEQLYNMGIRFIVVRAAGYDNIALDAAKHYGLRVANVPDYSPYAIAEHTLAMILALNRKLIRANTQVHQYNFLPDALIGFDLNGKTAGIVGTGRIGSIVAKILHGFGCTLKGYDVHHNEQLTTSYGLEYCDLISLTQNSDIITLHTPLNEFTRHLINSNVINQMKPGAMLINTSRGPVVNTADVLDALLKKQIGYFGMDVYEHEKGIFFHDHSHSPVSDKLLDQLMKMDNVLITPHQAFATQEAIRNIAEGTIYSFNCWQQKNSSRHALC